jgi:exopolyphosphatase/guanosine-5'-triphosphate,3'-diphosphate pyrophosphatase
VTAKTLAVVDLGANSFRLEIGRVEGDQIYRQDTWRETLRFGAGIDRDGRIKPAAMKVALACLARFRERLSGVHPSAVRAVATSAFRVAANAREFLPKAERALGSRIDVISGHEEARLIYLGVAHELPPSDAQRLVVYIGGGSTEFIIGRGLEPDRLESLTLGCVSTTQKFFPDGMVTASAFDAAETAARVEIEAIAGDFGAGHWKNAYASSGTAAALAEILEQNGFSGGGITPAGLDRLKRRLVRARDPARLERSTRSSPSACRSAGRPRHHERGGHRARHRADRSVSCALAGRALRPARQNGGPRRSTAHCRAFSGPLPGRPPPCHSRRRARRRLVPPRSAQGRPGGGTATALGCADARDRHVGLAHRLSQARRIHPPACRHAWILGGASRRGVALLVYGCRGGLTKVRAGLGDPVARAQIAALRLAVLFCHARTDVALPHVALKTRGGVAIRVNQRWLASHPLTAYLLDRERAQWQALHAD